MRSRMLTIVAGLAGVAMIAPLAAVAQDAPKQGYLLTTDGNVVRAPVAGVCVRTSDWTPARAIEECDPDLVKKPAPPPPPPPAKPAPPPPPPPPAPAPKPAAKPAAKPQMVPVELKLVVQNFEFDKSNLTESGKKEIDEFMTTWKGVTLGAIVITGHTDRIGSVAYNKKLSERRAMAAKDYLVGKGVDQKLIFWEGKGKAVPIPVTKFCENKMPRKQLIACLGPNRRVEIEVVGTKPAPAPKPKPEAKPEAKP